MRFPSGSIDEYTLAAYLSGRLTPRRRREVARLLAQDEEARELLLAARDLLDAQGDGAAPRRPPLLTRERVRLAVWIAAVVVLLVAVATTTMVAVELRGEVGHLRSLATPLEDSAWDVTLFVNSGTIAWEGSPDAARYRVVFWSGTDGRRGLVVPVEGLAFDLSTIPPDRVPGLHAVWIEALDGRGEPLRRTRSFPVVLER